MFWRRGCDYLTSLRSVSFGHVVSSCMASPLISASVIILHGTCWYTILFQMVGFKNKIAGCPGANVSMMVLAAFMISASLDFLLKVTVRLLFSAHLARMALML